MSLSPLHKSIITFLDRGFNVADEPAPSDTDLIQALIEFDALYADDESTVTDIQYDALRMYTKVLLPTHKYFLGTGSEIRGGKVDLPFQMGSLNQVQIGNIEQWVTDNNLQNEEHVASDKMDGTSALIIYDDTGAPQIAYSRGDGLQGADISRHIFKIKNVPTQVSGAMVVRAEVEMTESNFIKFQKKYKRSGGGTYKNARNAVAGLMNGKHIHPDEVYGWLNVIAYEVLDLPISKKMQLRLLKSNGFQIVEYTILKGHQLTDSHLAKLLTDRKDNLDYAIDGLVIEVNDVATRHRMIPTKETLNPEYAIKYKVADADNYAIAKVVGVNLAVSKHGYIKPTIEIDPTELLGVTVTNCTGFNMRYIYDNKIQPGCKISITRSGDVIPTVLGVVNPGELK